MSSLHNTTSQMSLKQRMIGNFASVITLILLAAVGYAGHSTHWTFQWSHGGGHDPVAGGTESAVPKKIAEPNGLPVNAAPDQGALRVTRVAAGETTARNASGRMQLRFDAAQSVQKTGVEVQSVKVQPIMEKILANGVISYDQHLVASVSGLVAGKVWRVDRRLGDPVKKGELLALIESLQVGEAKANFLSCLAIWLTRDETLRNQEAVGSAIAQRLLRESRLAAQEARISLLNAEQTLVNLGLPVKIDDYLALTDVERAARIRLLGIPADVAAQLESQKTTSNLLPLVAPFDGVVIGRDVGLGEVVEPAKALFEIADVRKMWVILNVRKEDAYKLKIGQNVRFNADGLPRALESRLSWISNEVDERTRTLQVRAEIENVPQENDRGGLFQFVRANTFGVGTIEVSVKDVALVVPNEAVHSDGDEQFVFLKVDDKTFDAVAVRTGLTDGHLVEIVADLPRNSIVAVRGSHALKSKMLLARIEAGEF